MDRRKVLAGLALSLIPGAAVAAPIGLSASPQLLAAFNSVPGIREGNGPGTLHVLFTPWCHVSPQIYRDSRSVVQGGRLSLRWIPFSGGQPEASEAVERLLHSPHSSVISSVFTKLQPLGTRPSTPLSDAQDAAVATRIQPQVIRDTGSQISTPTLAYGMRDGRVQVVPHGISPEDFEQIAAMAA